MKIARDGLLTILCVLAGAASTGAAQQVTAAASFESVNPQHVPLAIDSPDTQTMRVVLRPQGGYGQRDNCPQTSTLTNAPFDGGTYTAQGGFAEGEIAAATYTLNGTLFPLKVTLMEFIIAQSNASVQTTTMWSVMVWDGVPTDPQPPGFPVVFSSDGDIIPHIIMGPGTRATNVQAQVDPQDPEQIYVYNPTGAATHSFTIGFRIDQHNSQTQNPCNVPPPSDRNAFPCTDNTQIGCGTGYGALNYPTQNWLYAVNCGSNGCPPNGGWTRFSTLQTDYYLFGFCITGCRPRGDWVMRATWDPVNCPPPDGACCFGTSGCFLASQTACGQAGGVWRGAGTTCGTPSGGQFPGCQAPPNNPPVAQAGPDQSVTDTDNSGAETVVLDGSGSTDPDAGDFIANFRWSEGPDTLQDGPAFLSYSFPVGVHNLTLTVTDSQGLTDTDEVVVTVVGGAGCDPDVNCDGAVNGFDIQATEEAVNGDFSNFCQSSADLNGDGSENGFDIETEEQRVNGEPC